MDGRPSGCREAPVDRTRRTGRLVRRPPPTCRNAARGGRQSAQGPQLCRARRPPRHVSGRPSRATDGCRCRASPPLRVPQAGLDGLHRLPVLDEQARVEVPEGVHGHAAEAGRLDRRAPDAFGKRRPPDGLAHLDGEDEPVGRPGRDMCRQCVDDDLEKWHTRTEAADPGGVRYGARSGIVTSCRSTVSRRRSRPGRLLGGAGGHRDAADSVLVALRRAHPRPAVPSEDRRDR